MKCLYCGFENLPEMKFCGQCGTSLSRACANCGFRNPLNYRFCGQCGKSLTVETTLLASIQPLEPPNTAQTNLPIPFNGYALPPAVSDIKLEGERRIVTVMVTDVNDSTELLEQLGSEAWVELMNQVLHIQEAEIYRFGGEVDQFRGDGLVAFFGASLTHEDDPERSVLAGLSMQRAIKQYTRTLTDQDGIEVRIRVGINTGEVILTNVGDRRQHHEDTAMGIAVAVAARMENAAEPDTILVSENTYRLTTELFNWLSLGEITVKGVSQPIAIYRPLSPKLGEDQMYRIQASGTAPPLIGRTTEIQVLQKCIDNLHEGHGQIVTIVGEKGLGKTYLVNEIYQAHLRQEALWEDCRMECEKPAQGNPISVRKPQKWLRGRCRSYDQTWPYSAWIDLIHNWLGTNPDDSRETARDRLHAQAEQIWGEKLAEYYPYLAIFLSLPLEENFSDKIKHLNAEELRQRIFITVRNWIGLIAQQEPLVLVFSNLQWIDTSSYELLKYCLPMCDQEPILFLLLFRPDRASLAWELREIIETEYPHRSVALDLTPFTESQSDEFINWLVGTGSLTNEERNLIYKTSEGNPYYINELINTLMVRGALVRERDTGQWKTSFPITSLDLPDSLQRLLLVRIGRLKPEERYVLQIASVIGRTFWFNVLEAIATEAKSLKADLATLQRSQFIRESNKLPSLGMSYMFKTTLTRDAAYESLLTTQRVIYHAKVAEYLEDMPNPDILVGYYGILAYHFRYARQIKKELYYTLQAAEQARKFYSNKEALERYDRALVLLDEIETNGHEQNGYCAICAEKFEVLLGRSQVHYLMGNLQAGAEDSLELLPLARHMSDDPAWLIDALLNQPVRNREELAKGLPMKEEALSLSRQIGDRHREMQSLVAIAFARYNLKDTSWKETAQQALDLARQLGDLKTEVSILLGVRDAFGMDDIPRSREYLESALHKSESLNDKAIEMELLAAIGQQFEREGNYYHQLTEYEQKRLRISREIGDRLSEGQALMYCGQIQAIYLGDYEGGLALEEDALHVWEQTNRRLFPLLRIAQIQILRNQFNEAKSTLGKAQPIGEQIINDLGKAGILLVNAILGNALGDLESIQNTLEVTNQVIEMVSNNQISRQYQMVAACESSEAHLQLAELSTDGLNRKYHQEQALMFSQNAIELYKEFGFTQVTECTYEEILYRHYQALLMNGKEIEAVGTIEAAFQEMMRKYDFIPSESYFRKTYLENIKLHRDIRSIYLSNQVKARPHSKKDHEIV